MSCWRALYQLFVSPAVSYLQTMVIRIENGHVNCSMSLVVFLHCQAYFEVYFRLLREDCFATLRECVEKWRAGLLDPRDMQVFTQVTVTGISCPDDRSGASGVILVLQPPKNADVRGKLMFGNLLAISPRSGDIRSPIWATLCDSYDAKEGLQAELCSGMNTMTDVAALKLLLSTTCVVAVSPCFYRAYQPVLSALQTMRLEPLVFADELVHVKKSHDGTSLAQQNLIVDATCVYNDMPGDTAMSAFCDRLARKERKDSTATTLDSSQLTAIKHVLENRISIVQGPPGTGKTFIGIRLVQLLLSMKLRDEDVTNGALDQKQHPVVNGPILVLTYKNHALDDFLTDCLDPKVVGKAHVARIGGRDLEGSALDECNIRTLVRAQSKPSQELQKTKIEIMNLRADVREQKTAVVSAMETIQGSLSLCLETFKSEQFESQLMSLFIHCPGQIFRKVATPAQSTMPDRATIVEHLMAGDGDAVKLAQRLIQEWKHRCSSPPHTVVSSTDSANSHLHTRFDHDQRELEEMERLAHVNTSSDKEGHARWKRDITKLDHAVPQTWDIGENDAATLLNRNNIWTLQSNEMSQLRQVMISRGYDDASASFLSAKETYAESCTRLQKARELEWVHILSKKKVLGMTITGASIHHSLLQQLKPSVVIVEEAAEVLEPQLVATLGSHVRQLIMIGDHKQLRPNVESYHLCKNYKFDVSLMERLINNNLPFAMLEQQGRMRPEFAMFLLDIYPAFQTNTELVTNVTRPPPSCVAQSVFFWDHSGEGEDAETVGRSPSNLGEANRVVALALYLITQGYRPAQITLLGAYSGQVKVLKELLEKQLPKVWSGQLSNREEEKRLKELKMMQIGDHNEANSPKGDVATIDNERADRCLQLGLLLVARGDLRVADQQFRDGLAIVGAGVGSDETLKHKLRSAQTSLAQLRKSSKEFERAMESIQTQSREALAAVQELTRLGRDNHAKGQTEFAQATFVTILKLHAEGPQAPRPKGPDRLIGCVDEARRALDGIRRDLNTVQVHTIDRYQGAENEIVIVSLVRTEQLGYLNELNRRCVAQSRARCGLYFVGKSKLFASNATWRPFIKLLNEQGRLGRHLTLTCPDHPQTIVHAETGADIDLENGVCQQPCMKAMAFCDHLCLERCHANTGHYLCTRRISVTCDQGHTLAVPCHERSLGINCSVCTNNQKLTEEHRRAMEKMESKHRQQEADLQRKEKQKANELVQLKEMQKKELSVARQRAESRKKQAEVAQETLQAKQAQSIRLQRLDAETDAAIKHIRQIKSPTRKQCIVSTLDSDGEDAAEYKMVLDRTEKYAQSGHGITMQVCRIEKVTNLGLEEKWLVAKQQLKHPFRSATPQMLFHGTSKNGVKGITENGFRLPEPSDSNMFGCGIYFATDSTKSAQELYTKGSNRLLLCKVLLGRSVTVKGLSTHAEVNPLTRFIKKARNNHRPYLDVDLNKIRGQHFDSVYAKAGTRDTGGVEYDEYIVYDAHSALPAYIVHYGNGSAHAPQVPRGMHVGSKQILKAQMEKAGGDPFLRSKFNEAFTQYKMMLGAEGKLVVKSVEYYGYEHSTMQQAFDKKQQDFKARKVSDSVIWVFHGTAETNVEPIMTGGFKVGGKDTGVGVVNGAAYGHGVYSATGPGTPMGYGRGSNGVILAQALPGHTGPQGTSDSWCPNGDWYIFKEKEQVLPCYVVRYA